MTKADLVAKIANEGGILKSQAEKAVWTDLFRLFPATPALTTLKSM